MHASLDGFIRECLGSGKFRVQADGKVFNRDWNRTSAEREVIPVKTPAGYLRIGLKLPDRRIRYVMLHRLVAMACHGSPANSNIEVDHLDGDKTNNAAENLQWVDRSENQRRAYRSGLRSTAGVIGARGSRHPSAKLTDACVRKAHRRLAEGMRQADIAAELGITQSAVSLIATGKNWPHIYREFHQ